MREEEAFGAASAPAFAGRHEPRPLPIEPRQAPRPLGAARRRRAHPLARVRHLLALGGGVPPNRERPRRRLRLPRRPRRRLARQPDEGGARHLADRAAHRREGQLDEKEGVFKVSVSRNDLQPTGAGVKLPTSMGLTAWAAIQGSPGHIMVMGDLVLAEDQVNPVMSVALENGLQMTALHNHFLWETPRVMFMHVAGMGDEKALASAVGKVFARRRPSGLRRAGSRRFAC